MENKSIHFKDKTFLFTGTLIDIERKDAEKEVKLRGGYPAKGVSRTLDYLVVGTIPNPDWKFGSYGNKINDAIKLRNTGFNIQIISEDDFIKGLIETQPAFDENSEEKVLLIRFGYFLQKDSLKLLEIENEIECFANANKFYMDKSYFVMDVYSDLYQNFENIDNTIFDLIVDFRLIQHFKKESDTNVLVKSSFDLYASFDALQKNFTSHEWYEGTSVFMKLLNELPINLRIRKK